MSFTISKDCDIDLLGPCTLFDYPQLVKLQVSMKEDSTLQERIGELLIQESLSEDENE